MPTGKKELDAHNSSVATILVALLYQAVENYFELRRMDHRLQDILLEGFLSNVDNSGGFVDGMRLMRNSVFHVPKSQYWRRAIRDFSNTCKPRGGIVAVMAELRIRLYDFTEKVFLGKLRIWPDIIYQDWEWLEKERPDLIKKYTPGKRTLSKSWRLFITGMGTGTEEFTAPVLERKHDYPHRIRC